MGPAVKQAQYRYGRNGDYGQNRQNSHFGHNCHNCHCGHNPQNQYYRLIWVSMEAYGLQESCPALQNPLKYFFQIQKGKKQTDHIFPLAKTAFTPETSIEKCE